MPDGESRCPRCGTEVPADARFCPACGYATTRLSPGQILDGKYQILDKIAEGGMGHVYRARHIHLDEIRIIKVTKPDPIGEGAEPRRFQEEARIATLVRHPNVAALYDFSRLPDGSFYMVWEFIDGVTLAEWLRTNGAMPAPRALDVAQQVLSGLSEIHAQGIVHRDLAPDNIMLRQTAGGRLQAKIIDLGIAKRVASEGLQMTSTGMFVGKLKYCSPEQAGSLPRGERVDARSDLYSFGVVLYEMVTGRPPFEAQTPEGYLGQHLHTPPPPLDTSKLPAAVGPTLSAILKRALEKNRSRRFRDAEEFRQALARLESAPVGGSDAAETTELARPGRGFGRVAGAAALLSLAAAIAAYLLIHRPAARRPPSSASLPPTAAVSSPTPEAAPSLDGETTAPRTVENRPGAPPASSRSVADPSEAGAVRPQPTAESRPTPAAPARVDTPLEESEGAPEVPARMDAEATRRFRKFYQRWSSLPVDRQSAQAPALARIANLFVSTYPDDPLSGELRQSLPASLKRLAEQELDARRPRVAVRFYEAYRELDFAGRDEALDRRFASLPRGLPPGHAKRPG